MISPYFLLIPKSVGAWRCSGGVNSAADHSWLSYTLGNWEILSFGLFDDLLLVRHGGDCKVDKIKYLIKYLLKHRAAGSGRRRRRRDG